MTMCRVLVSLFLLLILHEQTYALLIDDFSENEISLVASNDVVAAGSRFSLQQYSTPNATYYARQFILTAAHGREMPIVFTNSGPAKGLTFRSKVEASAQVNWDLRPPNGKSA